MFALINRGRRSAGTRSIVVATFADEGRAETVSEAVAAKYGLGPGDLEVLLLPDEPDAILPSFEIDDAPAEGQS